MNILVLCTGNSARSILLEHILNSFSERRVKAFSAGSKPTGVVHPKAIKTLHAHDIEVLEARSKSWDEFGTPQAPVMDIVITVCGNAADEICPIWPGTPVRAHWGVDDPAAAASDMQVQAFEAAYQILKRRADALFDLQFITMTDDELTAALMRISTLV